MLLGAPHDIDLDFGGLTVNASSGDDFARLWFAKNCTISNVRVSRSNLFDGCVVALDSGGRDNTIRDCDVGSSPTTWAGIEAVENVRPRIVHCKTQGQGQLAGVLMQHNIDAYVEDVHSEGPSLYGIYFRALVNDALHGNLNPKMVGTTWRNTAHHAIHLDNYTTGMRARGNVCTDAGVGLLDLDMAKSDASSWTGLYAVGTKRTVGGVPRLKVSPDSADTGFIECGPVVIDDVTDIACTAKSEGGCGLYAHNASTDNQFDAQITERNSGYGARCEDSSSMTLIGWTTTDDKSGGVCYASSGDLTIAQSKITNANKGQPGIVTFAGATGVLRVSDTVISVSTDAATNAACFELADTACTVLGHDLTLTGDRIISITGTGATVHIDGPLRMIAAEPVVLAGGATQSQCNIGSASSDGAGALSIAFTQVTANSTVKLYDGVTGLEVISAPTITAATKVDWTGLAATHLYYAQVL